MNLLIWAVVAYGMTNILVYGSIFNGIRQWIHKQGRKHEGWFLTQPLFSFISGLISCVLCTSTWVGFFLSMAYYSPNVEIIGLNKILAVFFDGMLGAGFVWGINAIIEWFEENRPNNK
jgi:hypothetical protein